MVHRNINQVKGILDASGVNYQTGETKTCVGCKTGKQTKLSHQMSITRTERLRQLIHLHLCGPMKTISLERLQIIFINNG